MVAMNKYFTVACVLAGIALVRPCFGADTNTVAKTGPESTASAPAAGTPMLSYGGQSDLQVIEETPSAKSAAKEAKLSPGEPQAVNANTFNDPLRYTLGPDDVVEIAVMRHPEFSGVYPINLEGKIQYKFVGDIEVRGLTKKELEQKVRSIISNYVIEPEINVTITEYKSKVIYVLGEVGAPGKYYMRSEAIPIREAVVAAGLPTFSAAMRRCHLITPTKGAESKTKYVDLYSVLYEGDLKKNVDMRPGDVLYVPSTVMAKVIRVISPVTNTVGTVASGPSSAQSGQAAVSALGK